MLRIGIGDDDCAPDPSIEKFSAYRGVPVWHFAAIRSEKVSGKFAGEWNSSPFWLILASEAANMQKTSYAVFLGLSHTDSIHID